MIAFVLTGNSSVDLLLIVGCALFIAGYLFFQVRDSSRPCPKCGGRVKTGQMDCQSCGFDFRTIGRG